MKKQQGYTIIELIFVVGFVAAIGVAGGLLYVACHFIAKFW